MNEYLQETKQIIDLLDQKEIQKMLDIFKELKEDNGRLFILGVGGSAANASHAVNDFRKICDIQSYTPTDNVSELTARTNDDGWENTFWRWLWTSRMTCNDAILVLSVGGGSVSVSNNIAMALSEAKKIGVKIMGIVSRDGGITKQLADACVLIPIVNEKRITPHAEEFQGIIWHLLANTLNC